MMAAGDYTNSNAVDLVMIPLSDYNQTEGKNVKLKENEVLLYHRNHKRTHKKSDTEALKNKKVIQLNSISYKVVDELDRLARWMVCSSQRQQYHHILFKRYLRE